MLKIEDLINALIDLAPPDSEQCDIIIDRRSKEEPAPYFCEDTNTIYLSDGVRIEEAYQEGFQDGLTEPTDEWNFFKGRKE